MFGYVRPNREELRVRELRDYEALYCGLCHMLGQRHGFLARMFLNYDIVLLAMVLDQTPGRPALEKRRCPARLWCAQKQCACSGGLEAAADAGTILSYWKLRDAVSDGAWPERLAGGLLSRLLGPAYRRAAALRPEYDRTVRDCLTELRQLEADGSPSLDRTADTFARMLQAAAPPSGEAERDRAMAQLLYHLGRWIYLVDAWDDLEEDRRKGNYNPISARFPGEEEANRAYLRTTLGHSLNLARSAWALLTPGAWGGTVDNVLFLGLPLVEELVFTGRWKAAKKRKQ